MGKDFLELGAVPDKEPKDLLGLGKIEKKQDETLTWEQALREGISNIPSSAYETGRAMATPFIHPVETGKSIGRLAAGLAQKLYPGEQEYEKDVDAVVDAFKDRYGSVENFKKTVSKDPVGIATDIASFLVPGGAVVKGPGIAGKSAIVSKIGSAITKVGTTLEPVGLATKGLSIPFKILPGRIPTKMYQSAAKFKTTLTPAQRDALTKTALKYDITPTVKGVDKTRELIDGLNTKIVAKIDSAVNMGATIPIDDLFKEFSALSKEALKTSGTPIQSLASIKGVEKEIRRANRALKRKELTPMEAQRLKQRIYKELETEYSKIAFRPAHTEALMKVAKAAKEGIEDIIPEIKMLNAEEGALINLRKAIERSSARISNRDILGIGVPIKGTLGGIVGGGGGATAGLVMGVLDTPAVKAKLAIVLNRLKQKGIRVRPSAALARLTFRGAGELEQLLGENDIANKPKEIVIKKRFPLTPETDQ